MKREINITSFKDEHMGLVGSNNPLWKGESAGYGAKHDWIKKWYGEKRKCEICGTTKAIKYDWANISGNYLRVREDWKRLCRSCHHIMDGRGAKTWQTRIKKYGKSCLKCSIITTSKHSLCPSHLKEMFNRKHYA